MTIKTYKDDEEYLSNGYVITFSNYDYNGTRIYYNIDYLNNHDNFIQSKFYSIKIPNDLEVRFDKNPLPITESQKQFNKHVFRMYIQKKGTAPTLTNAPSSIQYTQFAQTHTEVPVQVVQEQSDKYFISNGYVLLFTENNYLGDRYPYNSHILNIKHNKIYLTVKSLKIPYGFDVYFDKDDQPYKKKHANVA